ncbi:MAG: hypothetical protein AB1595_04065 [bacterium]
MTIKAWVNVVFTRACWLSPDSLLKETEGEIFIPSFITTGGLAAKR